jgi:hypothetical protein
MPVCGPGVGYAWTVTSIDSRTAEGWSWSHRAYFFRPPGSQTPPKKAFVLHMEGLTRAKIRYHTCGSRVEYMPDLLDD